MQQCIMVISLSRFLTQNITTHYQKMVIVGDVFMRLGTAGCAWRLPVTDVLPTRPKCRLPVTWASASPSSGFSCGPCEAVFSYLMHGVVRPTLSCSRLNAVVNSWEVALGPAWFCINALLCPYVNWTFSVLEKCYERKCLLYILPCSTFVLRGEVIQMYVNKINNVKKKRSNIWLFGMSLLSLLPTYDGMSFCQLRQLNLRQDFV